MCNCKQLCLISFIDFVEQQQQQTVLIRSIHSSDVKCLPLNPYNFIELIKIRTFSCGCLSAASCCRSNRPSIFVNERSVCERAFHRPCVFKMTPRAFSCKCTHIFRHLFICMECSWWLFAQRVIYFACHSLILFVSFAFFFSLLYWLLLHLHRWEISIYCIAETATLLLTIRFKINLWFDLFTVAPCGDSQNRN